MLGRISPKPLDLLLELRKAFDLEWLFIDLRTPQ